MNNRIVPMLALLTAITLVPACSIDPLNWHSCTPIGSQQCIQEAREHSQAVRDYREDLAEWEQCDRQRQFAPPGSYYCGMKPTPPR